MIKKKMPTAARGKKTKTKGCRRNRNVDQSSGARVRTLVSKNPNN